MLIAIGLRGHSAYRDLNPLVCKFQLPSILWQIEKEAALSRYGIPSNIWRQTSQACLIASEVYFGLRPVFKQFILGYASPFLLDVFQEVPVLIG